MNLFNLIDFHYKKKANLTTVLIKNETDRKKKSGTFSSNSEEEYMVYALEENTNRLVTAICSYDMMTTGIFMKSSNLVHHPRVYFESQVEEANILVFDISIVNILKKYGKKFNSITEDFVPFLSDNQYNKHLLEAFRGEVSDDGEKGDEDIIEDYFNDTIEKQEFESFRPFAYVSNEFCK